MLVWTVNLLLCGPRCEKTCLLGVYKQQRPRPVRAVWSAPLLFAYLKVHVYHVWTCCRWAFNFLATKPVSGVSNKDNSNQSPQLQALARNFKFCSSQNWIIKGAVQTAQMHRLVCAFVVLKALKTGLIMSRSILCGLSDGRWFTWNNNSSLVNIRGGKM